jgi:hypothetical protein
MKDKTSYRTITAKTIEDGEYAGYTLTETTYHGECALVAALGRILGYADVALDCDGLTREAREWLEAINDLALSAHAGDDITLWDVGR